MDNQKEDNPNKIKKNSYFDFIKRYFCIPHCKFIPKYDHEIAGDTIKISKLINIPIPIPKENKNKNRAENFKNNSSKINEKPEIFNSFVYEDSRKLKENKSESILKICSLEEYEEMSNLLLVDNSSSDRSNIISFNLDNNENEKSFDSESCAVSSDSDS
jgi:hypothetical protein